MDKEEHGTARQFPPDVEKLIEDRLIQGGYSSEGEVLRDALRVLEEISYFRPNPNVGRIWSFETLRQEVSRGLDQLARWEGRDSDEVFDELLRDLPNPGQDRQGMRVPLSPLAAMDPAEIKNHIASDKPRAAARLVQSHAAVRFDILAFPIIIRRKRR